MYTLSDVEFNNLRMVLGEMYTKFGATDEVVQLSQILDRAIVSKQKIKYMEFINSTRRIHS